MDLKKYRLFVDAAESGNFTISGERHGYTQSGVSHIIKGLEAEIGFPLFVRTRRGVTLTPNGERLLPLVRQLIADASRLQQTVAALNGLNTGSITIGTYSSISIHWLPKILYEFQKDYPGIDIHMKAGGIDEIESWIDNSVVDFGFCSRRDSQAFDWIFLQQDPLMAILPADDPLPPGGAFPIADFDGKPFIISAEGIDHDIHLALTKANVTPSIRFSSTDDHAIVSMVANRLGVSILPNLILPNADSRIAVLPLSPYAYRSLGIGIKALSDLSPAAATFIRYARRILCPDATI